MDQDAEDLEELLNPHSWADTYYAVVDEGNELIGFFCFDQEEIGVVTIGLGLRPDYTGKGLGRHSSRPVLTLGKKGLPRPHFA